MTDYEGEAAKDREDNAKALLDAQTEAANWKAEAEYYQKKAASYRLGLIQLEARAVHLGFLGMADIARKFLGDDPVMEPGR